MSDKSNSASLLHIALVADAIASGATGIMLFAGAGFLSFVLGLPETEMRYVGAFLLAYATLVGWVAGLRNPPSFAVWAIIAANAIWVIDSILLLFVGWVSPTSLGIAFIVAQALVVAALACAQFLGLRRSMSSASFPVSQHGA